MAKVRVSWVRKVCTAFSMHLFAPYDFEQFFEVGPGMWKVLLFSIATTVSPELPSLSDTAIAARCIICSPVASCVKKMDSLTNECYGFLCFIQLRSKSVYLDGAIDLYWMAHIWNLWNKHPKD